MAEIKQIKEYSDFIKGLQISSELLTGLQERIVELANATACREFDTKVRQGLERKGFIFKTEPELQDFIKRYCAVEDTDPGKVQTFYTGGEPFLVHHYETRINGPYYNNAGNLTLSACAGYYTFI